MRLDRKIGDMSDKVNTSKNNKQKLRLLFFLVACLFAAIYSSIASVQVAESRIQLLHELATNKDKYEILVRLGRVYADGSQYTKAIDCYRKALAFPYGKGNTSLLSAWEDLNAEQPFNANVHHGFGEMFEHSGDFDQAEMEYRQALKLSAGNEDFRHDVARVSRKFSDSAQIEASREHPIWAAFRKSVATDWSPPKSNDCFVTRCIVLPGVKGSVDVMIIGPSGSFVHDQSAVSFLKASQIFSDGLFKSQIFGCGCMSMGNEKRVACCGHGEFNLVETSLKDQCLWQIGQWYHDMNKTFGISNL